MGMGNRRHVPSGHAGRLSPLFLQHAMLGQVNDAQGRGDDAQTALPNYSTRTASGGAGENPPVKYVIPNATPITTAHPITLYQSHEIPVKKNAEKMATSPAIMPTNVAVRRTRRNPNASTKPPSSEP